MRAGIKRYVLKRLLILVPVLFIASIIIFGLVRIGPGNPALLVLGRGADESAVRALEAELGLHQPYTVQYIDWITGVVRGDFGTSIVVASGSDALPLIVRRLSVSLTLGLFAFIWALVIAIPVGVIAAKYRGESPDYVATSGAILGISMPNYWLGFLLIIVFAVYLGVLPSYGYVSPWQSPVQGFTHILLPSFAMGLPMAAVIGRMLRSELLEKKNADYIEVATSFGLPRRDIFRHYWFMNSLIPIVTVLGIQMRYILGGVVVIEEVFSIPGLGQLFASAIFAYDFPLVQGITIIFITLIIFGNLIVDVAYAYLDPRVEY